MQAACLTTGPGCLLYASNTEGKAVERKSMLPENESIIAGGNSLGHAEQKIDGMALYKPIWRVLPVVMEC